MMAQHNISASSTIAASPEKVYALIADYRNGHPRILPKPYFVSLHVEQGGYGAGTIIDFQIKVLGQIQSFHSIITEPVPGRVLVETDQSSGVVTTFAVEPRQNQRESFVTITTTLNIPDGFVGKIQAWMTSNVLRPIYVKELKQLAMVATESTGR